MGNSSSSSRWATAAVAGEQQVDKNSSSRRATAAVAGKQQVGNRWAGGAAVAGGQQVDRSSSSSRWAAGGLTVVSDSKPAL